jgi:hypothetical protein
MMQKATDAVSGMILSREDLLAEVAGALDELRDKLAGKLVMTHRDHEEELGPKDRNRLFIVEGAHIEAESGCLWVDVRPADSTHPSNHECLLTVDLRERANLGEGVFLIVLEKQYVHQDYGGKRTVYGVMPVPADSQQEAEAMVDGWLDRSCADVLQTCDPRIVWDDCVEDSDWEYVDFSFGRVEDAGEGEE